MTLSPLANEQRRKSIIILQAVIGQLESAEISIDFCSHFPIFIKYLKKVVNQCFPFLLLSCLKERPRNISEDIDRWTDGWIDGLVGVWID